MVTPSTCQETWTYGYDQKNHMLAASKRATDGGTLQLRANYVYARIKYPEAGPYPKAS